MQCPVCKKHMISPVDLAPDLSGLGCGECAGVWIAGAEYDIWRTQQPGDLPEPPTIAKETVADTQKTAQGAVTDMRKTKICPQCGHLLLPYRVGHGLSFSIDYLPFLYVYGRKDSTVSVMGANIYPEDVESVVYSDPVVARLVNSFSMSLVDDAQGNPRPCFEFELSDLVQRSEVEAILGRILPLGLARLSLDYKKAREEYPESVAPIIRTFGMNEGPFKEDQGRIKKRYVRSAS